MLSITGNDRELDQFMELIERNPDCVFWFRRRNGGLHWGVINIYEQFGVHLNVDEEFLMKHEKARTSFLKLKTAIKRYGGANKLAAATGMPIAKLIDWETGYGSEPYKPDVTLMQRMAKELKLTLDDVAAAFYGLAE